MSKLLFKTDKFEVRTWDIVKLSNGMIVLIMGSEFKYPNVDENTKIYLCTHPVSSLTSYCYTCHIVDVIEHCGCFDNAMEFMTKNNLNNPLYIHLDK